MSSLYDNHPNKLPLTQFEDGETPISSSTMGLDRTNVVFVDDDDEYCCSQFSAENNGKSYILDLPPSQQPITQENNPYLNEKKSKETAAKCDTSTLNNDSNESQVESDFYCDNNWSYEGFYDPCEFDEPIQNEDFINEEHNNISEQVSNDTANDRKIALRLHYDGLDDYMKKRKKPKVIDSSKESAQPKIIDYGQHRVYL